MPLPYGAKGPKQHGRPWTVKRGMGDVISMMLEFSLRCRSQFPEPRWFQR